MAKILSTDRSFTDYYLRLAVVIQPPADPGAPLIAKVIAIPEAKVKSMLSTTRP